MEQPAPSQIFTQAHRIYIRGVRSAIAERLQSAYGADWWQRGVLTAVGENQQANLERELAKPTPPDDLPQLLDTPHFPRIAQRHQAAAFANAFTNLDRTLALFRYLAVMRNEWAHVRDRQWTTLDALRAVQAMQEILISLRRPEALELHKMFQESLAQTDAIPQETLSVTEDPPTADAADDADADERSLLGFWRSLESYLVVESSVKTDDEEIDRIGRKLAVVLVRVTNTAPTGDGRPEIAFNSVTLEAVGAEIRHRRYGPELGGLAPGATVTREFTVTEKGLASAEFRISGKVDRNKLFQVKRRNTLPDEVVNPLLQQLAADLDNAGIEESLEQVVAVAAAIRPDLTLAEVSDRRNELAQLKPLIGQKREALAALFDAYQLNRESPLGAPFREVITLLEKLEREQLTAMDAAISNTDLPAIRAVARDFQQLQISVLRARENIRRRMARPPLAANAAAW